MANSAGSPLLPLFLLFLVTASGRPVKQAHVNTTNSRDVEGVTTLIKKFPSLQLPYLSGDPCYPQKLIWIECSNDVVPRVTALYLGARNLSGYIPDFSSMDALKRIYLHRNSLYGPIPDFLGTFPELTYLDLSYNHLTGGLPDSLANNIKIKLYLAGNSLQLPPPATTGVHISRPIPTAELIFPRLQLLLPPLPPSPQFLFPPLAPNPPSPIFQFPPLAPNPPSPVFQFPPLAPSPPNPVFQFPPLAPNPPSPVFHFPPLAPNPPSPVFHFPPLAPNPPSPQFKFPPLAPNPPSPRYQFPRQAPNPPNRISHSSPGASGGGGGSFDMPRLGKIKKSKLPKILKFTVPPVSIVGLVGGVVYSICCCKRRRNANNDGAAGDGQLPA